MKLQLDSISLSEYNSLAKGNSGFMKILIEKVIRQISEYRLKIESSIRDADLAMLREQTHHIKPMLISLKTTNLLDVFEQIKKAMDSQTLNQLPIEDLIDFIQDSFDHIIDTLRVELERL
jgi:hypothetical protein